jgi:phosphatidylglycerophosphate synthase
MNQIIHRYKAMKTRQAKDWWTVTFGDPASWFILSLIGDWKWVTPLGITILSLFIRIFGALMIGINNIILGVIMIQVGIVMDHMDGNLARYRKKTTLSGGFIDRIFDGLSFYIIITALGWHAVSLGSSTYILLIASMAGAFYLLICYIYWSYAYFELKELGASKQINPGAIELNMFNKPTWKIVLQGQKLIFKFHHIDYYFWISLFILVGKPELGVWFHFIIIGLNCIRRFAQRLKRISRFG